MHRDNVCVYMAHVCFMYVLVTMWVNLGVLKYVVCLCRGCDGCYVFCLNCEA